MTRITYKVDKGIAKGEADTYTLIAIGHSGYATVGKDIVCASVSTLMYTLAAMLRKHPEYIEDGTLKYSFEERNENNEPKAFVSVSPKPYPMAEDMIEEIFETIVSGMELLHDNYSNNVNLVKK